MVFAEKLCDVTTAWLLEIEIEIALGLPSETITF